MIWAHVVAPWGIALSMNHARKLQYPYFWDPTIICWWYIYLVITATGACLASSCWPLYEHTVNGISCVVQHSVRHRIWFGYNCIWMALFRDWCTHLRSSLFRAGTSIPLQKQQSFQWLCSQCKKVQYYFLCRMVNCDVFVTTIICDDGRCWEMWTMQLLAAHRVF